MWILPKNHSEYSAFAAESEDLNEELKEHWREADSNSIPLLMLKSKPLSLPTLLRAWKRVFWLRVLCGRTSRPSLTNLFTERYTASLEVIPASHSQTQETGGVKKTQGTSGPISPRVLEQYDLFGAFLKMCPDTLHSDMKLSGENYRNWVIELRKVYSLRRKSEPHTYVKDYLSSQFWSTPTTQEVEHPNALLTSTGRRIAKNGNTHSVVLADQAKKWTTPVATDQNRSTKYQQGGIALSMQVKGWPTPTVAEAGKIPNCANYGQVGLSNHPAIVGEVTREKKVKSGKEDNSLQDQKSPNTIGKKKEQLNPAWVAQLMGTTLGKTFFVPMVTESWTQPRN